MIQPISQIVVSEDGLNRKIIIPESSISCKMCKFSVVPGMRACVCEFDRKVICEKCAKSMAFSCSRIMLPPGRRECVEYCGIITREEKK